MKTSHWTMITGLIMALAGPVWGLGGSVFGMIRAFDTLGKSGVTDPKRLSEAIAINLYSTAGGLFVGAAGVVVFIVGIILWFASRDPGKTRESVE